VVRPVGKRRAAGARPAPDRVLVEIADYVERYPVRSTRALDTARLCLMDSLGCALQALSVPECAKLLGPLVPGTVVPNGARVPGTAFQLDPVAATFNLGALVRWLDYNDAFYGRTVIHPSDNIAGILMTADHLSRTRVAAGKPPLAMREVLEATVKAYEIQGWLALENGFTDVGLDHTMLVKIATCPVVARLLGAGREEILAALSNAWVDGHALATFRRKPNTGSRKSWAAGDAGARAVWLATLAVRGEMGYPSALSAPRWGFCDALFGGRALRFQRPLGTYVVENVLFKVAYPAAFHAQSGVEAAIRLHPLVKDRLDEIERVEVRCHRSSMVILDKSGPLANPADRDHCMQYMMAVGMIFGELRAEHYEDAFAADPRIDRLRAKMVLREEPRYSRDYLDPAKRSNANSIRVYFRDGTSTPLSEVEYPLGHPRRRKEAMPLLLEKFERSLARVFAPQRCRLIVRACAERRRLEAMPVHEFVDLFAF
jgi:2-methylcitrate dehydratase